LELLAVTSIFSFSIVILVLHPKDAKQHIIIAIIAITETIVKDFMLSLNELDCSDAIFTYLPSYVFTSAVFSRCIH